MRQSCIPQPVTKGYQSIPVLLRIKRRSPEGTFAGGIGSDCGDISHVSYGTEKRIILALSGAM